MTPLVSLSALRVAFGSGHWRSEVVHGIDLELEPGDRLGLIGESGSGKSVTALALMGLLPEYAEVTGSIQFEGRELVGADDRTLSRLRGDRMSMVFQEPMTALDPTMKVGRQVAEVWRLHQPRRGAGETRTDTRERVLALVTAVGLHDAPRVVDSYPHQLSGGQRQRVVLAMALINSPDLVICDEPTTALDVTVQARVLEVLTDRLDAVGAGCLFISHDLALVAGVCDRIAVMLDGRIVEQGPTAEVLGDPQHGYTRGLLATARLDRVAPGTRLPTVADFWDGTGRLDDGSAPRPSPMSGTTHQHGTDEQGIDEQGTHERGIDE